MSTLYPAPDRVNPGDDRDYGKLFRQWEPVWRRNGSTPGIFEYGGVYWPDESRRINSRFGYHPPAWLRFDEARWYRDRGVRYMYMCSIYNGWPDTFHLLAEARAMWEADGSASELAGRYYRALAGRVGTSLRGALEAVAEELRFQRDPARPLARLDALLAALAPEAFVKRYQAWSRYVRMASNGWSEETAGDHKKAIEWEARIQAFLKRLGKKLEEVLDPRFPIGYSRTKVARLKEWYPEVCDSSGPAETRSRLFI
jgi:hypothetical protein